MSSSLRSCCCLATVKLEVQLLIYFVTFTVFYIFYELLSNKNIMLMHFELQHSQFNSGLDLCCMLYAFCQKPLSLKISD